MFKSLHSIKGRGTNDNSPHMMIIPVQVHDHNSDDVVERFLSVNIDGNNLDVVTALFCEENAIQANFCSLLHDHVRSVVMTERDKPRQPPDIGFDAALALPNAHLDRHHSAVQAEYNRIFRPEIFSDFGDILRREQSIVQRLQSKWKMKSLQRLCFIHSCQIQEQNANSTRILEEIVQQIRSFGLEDILDSIIVLNYGNSIDEAVKGRFSNKIEVIEVHDEIHYFEVPTLRVIHSVAKHLQLTQPDIDVQVLYLHTKGVSYKDKHLQVEDWRNMMTHFLIEKHASCLHLLQSGEIDCVGTNYRSIPHPIFSGNFWWATGSYLAARPEQLYEDSGKYEAETWLLNNSHARIFVMHNSNIDHAVLPYPRSCYSSDLKMSTEHAAGSERCGGPQTMREIRKYWQLF